MVEGGLAMLTKPTTSGPTLALPQLNPADGLLQCSDAANSSPVSFMTSLLSDQDSYLDNKSYSQFWGVSPGTQTGGLMEPSVSFDMAENGNLLEILAGDKRVVHKTGGEDTAGQASGATARFKLTMPAKLPISHSPFLTIPPGLSPTILLDSPMLYSTGLVDLSPTSGPFSLPVIPHERGSLGVPGASGSKESSELNNNPIIKPLPHLPRNLQLSGSATGMLHQQAPDQVEAHMLPRMPFQSSGTVAAPVSETPLHMSSTAPLMNTPQRATGSQIQGPAELNAGVVADFTDKAAGSQVSVGAYRSTQVVERPSEDGYNWKKYGQKQVKGSEYPRSYYKCTYPNCPVKKKVERSHEGDITEIIYKGEHNHPKPQSTRRSSKHYGHFMGGLEREASISDVVGKADSDRMSADLSSSSSRMPVHGNATGTPELSLGSPSVDDGGGEDEDDFEGESDSKRRKIDDSKETFPIRTIREPRVVVQTTSEIDILDDGYRWRKYGQKVVKGNRHPRSYYKCTNAGCRVRKHVERSSTDSTAVITTYEGKHNHDVPVARNSARESGGIPLASSLLPLVHEDTGLQVPCGNVPMPDKDRPQGGFNSSPESALGLIGSGAMSNGTCDLSAQGLGFLRPKQEPDLFYSYGMMLQPHYPSGSSCLNGEVLSRK